MSKIIISDDQNTVEIDGKKYVAKKQRPCKYCSLYGDSSCFDAPCMKRDRTDKRNIIFKLQK